MDDVAARPLPSQPRRMSEDSLSVRTKVLGNASPSKPEHDVAFGLHATDRKFRAMAAAMYRQLSIGYGADSVLRRRLDELGLP